jgi:hypothetical protein
LTLPDPLESGEGALDPLGLATLGDHLADWILPGMTVRMFRPRFLTAIAVSAVVCEGLEESIAADGVSPSWLVMEWLVVESFARARRHGAAEPQAGGEGSGGEGEEAGRFKRTPGIAKAAAACNQGIPLCAGNYLKAPTVFGFHGVYKRLARHLGVVDDNLQLAENGDGLLRVWEKEQGLEGQILSSTSAPANGMRRILRAAVEEGLRASCTARKGGWQGWSFLAWHLAPGEMGPREAAFLRELLQDPRGDRRGEIFRLVGQPATLGRAAEVSEKVFIGHLLPLSSEELAHRLRAIAAYEDVATLLDGCWDWLRHLSTQAGARALPRAEFAAVSDLREAARLLPARLQAAEEALRDAPPPIPQQLDQLAGFFSGATDAETLYDSLLRRHACVQKGKPPEGKREWFEHAANDGVLVRIPYRLPDRPQPQDEWRRPYRLRTSVVSFCLDLDAAQR